MGGYALQSRTNRDHRNADMSYLDPTVKQIEETVNKMDVDVTYTGYLVLDTNILLGYLEVVQQFIDDLEATSLRIVFLVPGVVVQELDHQKAGDDSLAWSSRRAGRWIYEMLTKSNTLKGQAYNETCQSSKDWKKRDKEFSNDDLILDCCLYYRAERNENVALISADYNLCTKAATQGIPTVNPRDNKKWSSRELARKIFDFAPNSRELILFSSYVETKRPATVRKALEKELGQPSLHADEDAMEIDDGGATPVTSRRVRPSHVLDVLHYDIVDHFTTRLRDTVQRTSPHLFTSRSGASASMYSPASKPLRDWFAADCINHLSNTSSRFFPTWVPPEAKKRITSPDGAGRLQAFLADPYDGKPQARRGQEWARQEWIDCLGVLGLLAIIWDDQAIQIDITYLWAYVEQAFGQQMRPKWYSEQWYQALPKIS